MSALPSEAEIGLRACRWIIGCFAFLCVYFVGIDPGAPDANQRSHYQLLRALGERGTAEIDAEVRDFGWHTDIAVRAGHRYSDKAPGLSAAAVPAYRFARLFLPAPASNQDWLVFYAARLGSVTLVVVWALVAFARRVLRSVARPRLVPLWLFALLFATPFAVYTRSFFSHAFVAGLLFLGFLLLDGARKGWSAAAAGVLVGLAVASEYPVVVIALCLWIFAATKGFPRLAAFSLGAAIPAVLLVAYHSRYFGGVLAFPLAASEAYPVLAVRGVAGVSWPRPAALAGLFFDPAHGLLYFSPFLAVWPVVAIVSLRRLRKDPSLLVPALGPLLLLFIISGFLPPHWRGGWCLGPRYLVAGFLLLFWLLTVRISDLRPTPRFLLACGVVYGAVILFLCGSTYWMIPYEAWNPVRTVSAYFLKRGIVEYNLGVAAGLSPLVSLAPPAAAFAVAFFWMMRGTSIPLPELAGASLAGLALAGTLLAIRPSPEAVGNSHREGIASAIAPTLRARWR